MEIVVKFTNGVARSTEYYLRKRYNSKASLAKLAKMAILKEAADQAKVELGLSRITGKTRRG